MSNIVPPTNLKCNTHFYFEPLTFQVEDELFQLPRILFTECKTFVDLYPEIRTGSGPVILKDCTKKQFEAFLTAVLEPLYRMLPSDHPCSEPLQLDALLSALDLTKRWGFDQLSEDLSSNVSAVKKITLGRDHKIVSWFQSGLEELVLSEDDINLADAEEMGAMFTVRVYHARAAYWRKSHGGSVNASEIVEEVFAKELQGIANSSGDPLSQPRGGESSVQQIDEDAAPSDAESDDGDIGMLQLPDQNHPSLRSVTSGLAIMTSGATQDQQMKIVIRAVFGSNPHQTRSSPQLMNIVPKICQKKEEKCGDIVRCKACCSKHAKHFYSLGRIPRAKVPAGQTLLEKTILQQSMPTTLPELLIFVPKSCNKREETCGLWQRCGKCCRKKLKEMLSRNEMW